jgi:hydrogenase expression/formation protein HypC
MCLAVPALVEELDGAFARVDFGGVHRRIGTALVPGVRVGDYVLVHAGMAIETIDFEEAQQTIAMIREVFGDAVPEDAPSSDTSDE